MRQVFSRSFSSVYVHYIPHKGFGYCGTSADILKQTGRLAQRIKRDSERVQAQRATSWTKFDARQMSLVVHYAFTHLASGSDEPFDFGHCRQQISVPETTEGTFSTFLGYALKGDIEKKFDQTAAVLATSLLRNSVASSSNASKYIPHPAPWIAAT